MFQITTGFAEVHVLEPCSERFGFLVSNFRIVFAEILQYQIRDILDIMFPFFFTANVVDLTWLKTRLYDDYQVEVPTMIWNGLKLIRVSIQAYNSGSDADALIDALQALLDL